MEGEERHEEYKDERKGSDTERNLKNERDKEN
jgi:hypothetical protein